MKNRMSDVLAAVCPQIKPTNPVLEKVYAKVYAKATYPVPVHGCIIRSEGFVGILSLENIVRSQTKIRLLELQPTRFFN